jgi:hypothetical protein
MNTRKWLIIGGTVALTALLALALAGGLTQAQEPKPARSLNEASETEATTVSGLIPIQGRLTDDNGNPLDGVYNLTFSLYEQSTGGTAICSDSNGISVKDGLFNYAMGYCWDDLHGQQVWLGVEVESDGEMTPRQPIYPVPYAYSLRPGATISDSSSSEILTVRNNGSGTGIMINSQDGNGLNASTSASDNAAIYGYNSTTGAGVQGTSLAGEGVFGGSLEGVGIEASSGGSIALKASGTGVIQSSADIEISVSPLKMVVYNNSSDVEFMASRASMRVRPNVSGPETVYVPVDLPSVLFGATTKLKRVRVCYIVDQASSFIDSTVVGYTDEGGVANLIIIDGADRTSTSWDCYTITDSTPREILGSLCLQFDMEYAGIGSGHDIQIGSITLTLTEE